MDVELRFKHPFTCIVAGTTGSGKSSFDVKFLKLLKTQCNDSKFSGGIKWCFKKEDDGPL